MMVAVAHAGMGSSGFRCQTVERSADDPAKVTTPGPSASISSTMFDTDGSKAAEPIVEASTDRPRNPSGMAPTGPRTSRVIGELVAPAGNPAPMDAASSNITTMRRTMAEG